MKIVSFRSVLLLAFLALPAAPLAGQTEAQLREIKEQEMQARRQMEEQLVRVREAHVVVAQEAQEQHVALRLAHEYERQVREEHVQERQRVLVRSLENYREQEKALQEVVVQFRSRARLGVSLDPRQGKEYDQQGVLVTDVHGDSPAAGAGLEEGDIITHLNGQSLLDPMEGEAEDELDEYQSLPVQRLMALVKELADEEAAEVRYLRDGAEASASMVPAEQNESWAYARPEGSEGGTYRYGPEGSRSVRIHIADGETIHLDEMKAHIDELTIEFEDMDIEDFEFEGGKDFHFRSSPNMAFFGPGGSWTTHEGEGQFEVLRGDNNAWSFYSQNHTHGLELRDLNPDLGSYFSAETGVLVMSVDEDSTLGLQAGDVILSIGDREVEDVRDFHRILGSYEDEEAVSLTIMRNGQETTVEGTAG
jgi:type II secretory pathway component PulC